MAAVSWGFNVVRKVHVAETFLQTFLGDIVQLCLVSAVVFTWTHEARMPPVLKVLTAHLGQACCLPCPATDWLYPDSELEPNPILLGTYLSLQIFTP